MKPKNFPEKKLMRRVRAAERLRDSWRWFTPVTPIRIGKKERAMKELGILIARTNVPVGSARQIRTKKTRSTR